MGNPEKPPARASHCAVFMILQCIFAKLNHYIKKKREAEREKQRFLCLLAYSGPRRKKRNK